MLKTVSIQEAQAQLPELLALTSSGDEVLIADGQTPLAKLVPFPGSEKKRIAGLGVGDFEIGDDFDEPLRDEFWTGQV